jgi:putative nucleotidyltransferase with HDIG domain
MPRSLKLYIAIVVTVGVLTLAVATFVFQPDSRIAIRLWTRDGSPHDLEIILGIAFWIAVTLLASALPVQMPRGTKHAVSIAPIVAAIVLGGPGVGGIVAALGTTEIRELRGRIPWYGTLANHAGLSIPAVTAGVVRVALLGSSRDLALDFVTAMLAAVVFYILNAGLAGTLVSLRTGHPILGVLTGDSRGTAVNSLALAPLAWLMSLIFSTAAWWATLLFALPLYTTRASYRKFVEMREMFTQTIGALAEAVDKRDPFTSRHSQNVKTIAVDIGRVMRVSDADLEALEWGGLLHDVGKIGVPDAVLLKQERLTREERMIMNAHPVLGAEIIAPVAKLAPELPIIRHHHEWYNGSGYPDRLMGDEIPRLARVLHVADAFEAMTAARPYRMTPLTAEQALGELRKFAGIQFDPEVVDAFVRTSHADGVPDPGRQPEPRPIPLLAQAANRMTAAAQPDMGPGAPQGIATSGPGPIASGPAGVHPERA